ncbi:unnamed protein product [Protopolystoma xenopodis]|uniref:Uncharacterized protein n=1 Tax=Protopolystoma xenopodis TaxID=117903 RepID=A0A448WIY8_9PLAT|nr:unnamed protein product [Protopolystoma xenopodis]
MTDSEAIDAEFLAKTEALALQDEPTEEKHESKEDKPNAEEKKEDDAEAVKETIPEVEAEDTSKEVVTAEDKPKVDPIEKKEDTKEAS